VSRELQRYFRDRYGIETTYIPNGVDLPHHLPPTPPFGLASGRYLLFLGRLVPEKDVLGLIEAYRAVKSDLPLVVAGPSSHSDDYVSELRRAASRDQRVRLVGPVYGVDKDALLAHAYAFCQPSKLEGLPIALLEALSFGRCAVASDLPEHLEVLRDPLTAAFTFRTSDRESLRSALAAAVARPDRVAAAGARGQNVVATHYSWDDVADSVETAYFELAAATSRFQDEIAPT
jgi:glycosyltransferase involved in cell wall biosynthesis